MVNLVVRLGARELVSTIQAVSLLTLVLAEPFYQRRDHLDQTRYLKVHNDNVVKDRDDAEVSMTFFSVTLVLLLRFVLVFFPLPFLLLCL